MRIAIIQVGDVEARFDGQIFTSDDEGLASILNSAMDLQRKGAALWPFRYYPDPISGPAKDCAEYHGGRLLRVQGMDLAYDPGVVY